MSHFSTIKTQLKEVKPLIKTLNQLGYVINQEKKFIKKTKMMDLLSWFSLSGKVNNWIVIP